MNLIGVSISCQHEAARSILSRPFTALISRGWKLICRSLLDDLSVQPIQEPSPMCEVLNNKPRMVTSIQEPTVSMEKI